MKWFEKIKEINKFSSGNDNVTIENTFWSTEVNFWPISANEGPLRVLNAVLVRLQWSQREYGVKNRLHRVSDLEHSILSYHRGPQTPETKNVYMGPTMHSTE